MLSDDELDEILETAQRVLFAIVQRTPLHPDLTERLLVLLRLIFPEWDISYEHRPDKVEWFGILKRDLSAQMREAGVVRTVRCPSGTRLATELTKQLAVLAQFIEEG
ncbi:hypothetical protein GCM10009850_047620 [Nonomuraea monospora]|uniref:Uncharacterized protein n=1 Tax=Nonomuraea monospora TaxID=568818 RepID=A0ABN3CIQ6_9ACTN